MMSSYRGGLHVDLRDRERLEEIGLLVTLMVTASGSSAPLTIAEIDAVINGH